MPYLTAHFLDRLNEFLVRRRLSGRLSPEIGVPIVEHLGGLGDEVHPDPASIGALEPAPLSGRLWAAPSPWPGLSGNNATWHAERFEARPADDGAPAVILLHGWLADPPQRLVYRAWARRAARRGLDVWLPSLPYHLRRADPGEVSGQRALSPDLSASLDMVRQAVGETRMLAAWLRGQGRRVGLWGMSLGGWVAALATTLEADWDAVALWAPVAAPAEVLFESGLVELLREAIVEGGLSRDDFDAAEVDPVTPYRRAPLVDRGKFLIVGAVYDQVVSPRSLARLARNWNVDIHWVPHGHISLIASRAPVRRTVDFLQHTLGR